MTIYVITYRFGRALVAQGISIAFAIRSFDLLVYACHNLTDCGTEECHYPQACVITMTIVAGRNRSGREKRGKFVHMLLPVGMEAGITLFSGILDSIWLQSILIGKGE